VMASALPRSLTPYVSVATGGVKPPHFWGSYSISSVNAML